jgi:nucleotide-binding universal stress UspA family protein
MTEPGNSLCTETIVSSNQPTLVAVDFSDDSRAAVLWACGFSACAGGKLVVLHVVHDPADQPGYYRNGREQMLQPMEQVAEDMLNDFLMDLQRAHPELAVLGTAERRLLSGLPPGRIVEAAELLDAKLIVIGSRGMTGLPHLMQGSVSERVVELAKGPVVVVKSRANLQRLEKESKKADKQNSKQEIKASKAEPDGV